MDDRQDATAPSEAAGPGALLSDRASNYADTRLMERAAREKWNVPGARRPQIVKRLCDIAEAGEDQCAVRAAAVLVVMDRADRDEEVHATKHNPDRSQVRKRITLRRVTTEEVRVDQPG